MIPVPWRYILPVFLCLGLITKTSHAQKAYADSLEKVLAASTDAKKRVALMNQLSAQYVKTNPEKSHDHARKALELAQKTKNLAGEAASYICLGNHYYIKGKYPESLRNYISAENILEELNDRKGVGGIYMGIGNVYSAQNNLPEARSYYEKALAVLTELGDKGGMSNCYNNLGSLYHLEKDFKKGLEYHRKGLQMKLQMNDHRGLSSSYGNIGIMFYELQQYDSALIYQDKALKLRMELNNKGGQAGSYISIGNILEKLNRSKDAITNLEKGVEIAKQVDYKEMLRSGYASLSSIHEKQGDTIRAFGYYKLYSVLKDTMLNAETAKQVATLQTVYETEKKEKEIVLLTKEREIQDLVLQRQEQELMKQSFENEKKQTEIELLNKQRQIQELDLQRKEGELKAQKLLTEAKEREAETDRMIRNFFMGGLGMTMMLAFFIYRGYAHKKKANIELANRNEKIRQAYKIIELNRDEIAQKSKDIQDSINYAQRIQEAILPPVSEIAATFRESMILFKPRNVVSGDFYAFAQKNGKTVLAAVDCTGHGVPGAFMSMIGNDQLNQIIGEQGITQPAEILSRLNRGIRQSLKQTEESESRDGMDIAICTFDHATNTVEYAGAQRPLWYISKGTFCEIKGNDISIGGTTPGDYSFTSHSFGYSAGDVFYMFSDGYADQFGGHNGKKFMNKRFRELLSEIHMQPLEKQKELLLNNFESWKNDTEQVDDVLVVGVRV